MALFILVLMIAVPLVEIAVFIQVGGAIGLWPTLATVIGTAIAGTALLRHQGLATLRRVQESLEQNRLPVREVFDGLCLLVAGALLLTPGFVTDAVGLLLFVPAVREALRGALARYLRRRGHIEVWTTGPDLGGRDEGGGTIINGDFREMPNEDEGGAEGPEGGDRDPPPRVPRR